MKVALCISGFLRTYHQTYNYLVKNIISVYNPDIFIETWSSDDRGSSFAINEHYLKNLFNPKEIRIEDPKTFVLPSHLKKIKYRDPPNLLSMFYKIKQCNELKSNFELKNNFKYDFVIRFRGDLQLFSSFDLNAFDKNKIHVPLYGDYNGLNDQLAIGSSQSMDIYCNLFDEIHEYTKKIELNPEKLLKFHLENKNIEIDRFYLDYGILRKNGLFRNHDFKKK